MNQELKKCTKCAALKPHAAYYKCKSMKHGLFNHCKACHLSYCKVYFKKNREDLLAKMKDYRSQYFVRERNKLTALRRLDRIDARKLRDIPASVLREACE